MCLTPKYFPKSSFIVRVLEKMEEIIGHNGEHYEIHFDRHMPHKSHFPKNRDVSDALGRVLMSLKIVYQDAQNNNDCNIFDENDDRADYAARALLSITQYFMEKNTRLMFLLGIPSVTQFRFRIYHVVLDVIIHSFIDHLIEGKNCLEKLKERIKKLEKEIGDLEEFIIQNIPPKTFLHNEVH